MAEIVRIRQDGKVTQVGTTWSPKGELATWSKVWRSPPMISDTRIGVLPVAATLTLTKENGQVLEEAWTHSRPIDTSGQRTRA